MESRDTPTKFVLDVVALLEALGDREYIPVFLEMLEYDGPDVEGAVAALIEHKQVNQDWIERLAAFNDEYAGAFDFELGELRSATAGGSAEQSSREAERRAISCRQQIRRHSSCSTQSRRLTRLARKKQSRFYV